MKPSRLSRLKIVQLFCWTQEVWTELDRLFRDPLAHRGKMAQSVNWKPGTDPGALSIIPGQWWRGAGRGAVGPLGEALARPRGSVWHRPCTAFPVSPPFSPLAKRLLLHLRLAVLRTSYIWRVPKWASYSSGQTWTFTRAPVSVNDRQHTYLRAHAQN